MAGDENTRGFLPLFVRYEEGGDYTYRRDPSAPVRYYPDRTIADDFIAAVAPEAKRRRMTRKDFGEARFWAQIEAKIRLGEPLSDKQRKAILWEISLRGPGAPRR